MIFAKQTFLRFVLVFAFVFFICYYGALFITGLAIQGGMYSPIVEKYFNLAAWLRTSLIIGTKLFVSFFNIETVRTDEYVLRIPNANGIRIVYSCLGFGVMAFWTAYIVATAAKMLQKIRWLFIGLLLIWIINVVRISMVLVAGYKGWKFPLGFDHHTWFNIIAYLAIFLMMFLFENNIKKSQLHEG